MPNKRFTKADLDPKRGKFNPVGHSFLAFSDDAQTAEARTALLEHGFADADLLGFSSTELESALTEMLRHASEAAGFGYEITLLRRYLALASEQAGWLLVYAPEEAQIGKVVEVAKRIGAKSAVAYHRLANEDLL